MTFPKTETYERKTGFDIVRRRVADLCGCVAARRMAADMAFSHDFALVEERLRQTAEMLAINATDRPLPLHNLHDLEPTLKRCAIDGTAIADDELVQLRQVLQTLSDISAYFRRPDSADAIAINFPRLTLLVSNLEVFPELVRMIDRIVDPQGNIRDNASPRLADIRSDLRRVSASISSAMRRVMSRAVEAGYLERDAAPAVRDGRLVLPVAPMHKRKIQGIVHDESATGKTIYIEPAEVVEINNRARELEMEERHEIMRILAEFTVVMRPFIPSISGSYEIAAQLDFINAKARFAADHRATMPHLTAEPQLEWYRAIHPVLLDSLTRQGKEIVPLDITLSPQRRILVISGPNAGGKSVCLKTVGLVQYMMQCGMLPTVAENSHMGIFHDLLIDIGDDQSMEDDLSTYSSHLAAMKQFLHIANPSALMMIDEFGSGTEPLIGGALAQAILEELNRKQVWGVVTTHYQNLKQLASDTPGLVNGSMLYDRQRMLPMFKLTIGNPGSSFAIEIARKTGLPPDIISKASEIVGSDYVNMDKYLLDIARDRRYWENKRLQIRQKEKKIDDALERYESEADTLHSQRREIIKEAKEEARKILEGSNAAIERTIREIRESQADKERTRQARRQLEQTRAQASDSAAVDPSKHPALAAEAEVHRRLNQKKERKRHEAARPQSAPIAVGDTVQLDGQGTPGRVVEVSGKNATVVFGMLKTTVKTDRLTRTANRIPKPENHTPQISTATGEAQRQRQLDFSTRLDVRGMRVDEALQAVTYYIDDAISFAQQQVRILHGTGTGALRQAIRQYLSTVPGVASYRDEHVQMGGAGITVVELE